MNQENPYAYYESQGKDYSGIGPVVNELGEAVSASEPRTPVHLSLKHKTGVFSSKRCEMTVLHDRLIVEGAHLEEPVVVERNHAVIKFKMTRLILNAPGQGKYKFAYIKDLEKELKFARLETWADPRSLGSDPQANYHHVEQELKKHCSWVTWSNVVFISVLQCLGFVIMLLFLVPLLLNPANLQAEMADMDRSPAFVIGAIVIGIFFMAFVIGINILSAVLLAYRQTWALVLVIVYYAFGLISFNPIAIVICLIILIQAIMGLNRLNRQLRQLKYENGD
ncbi:MAG: hypothetical protein FWC50_14075 [Planctomycetaceae bacterium]|nr:hypothetical protein [Planctomycetaceae bacterium]